MIYTKETLRKIFCAMVLVATLFVVREAASQVDNYVSLPADELSPDLVIVSSALILKLRGLPPPKEALPVIFERSLGLPPAEDRFAYEGFRVIRTLYGGLERAKENPNRASISGLFHFLDAFGRQAYTAFEADYEVKETAIHIRKARVAPYFPSDPMVEMFIVPAEAMTKDSVSRFANNAELLNFVGANALALDHLDQLPKGQRHYFVFAFSLDRLAPDDTLEIKVGPDPKSVSGESKDELMLDHAGWRVAMIDHTFAMGGGKEVFFKAVYTPGGSHVPASEVLPRVIGAFSSKDQGLTKYIRAAERGDAAAQFKLAKLYLDGKVVSQDYVLAHMWSNLAAAHGTGDIRDEAVKLRQETASKMTKTDISEAQRLARNWKPKKK
jgi:hypothetical protein